jgi:hypothetical protein
MILGCSCLHHTIRHHITNKTDSENAGALGVWDTANLSRRVKTEAAIC